MGKTFASNKKRIQKKIIAQTKENRGDKLQKKHTPFTTSYLSRKNLEQKIEK